MNKIKVGIIGATGYAGIELLRLLLTHPNVIVSAVSSVSFTNQKISDVHNSLKNIYDELLCTEDEAILKSDVIFASLPHGLSEDLAKKVLKSNKYFIDLGADFRLDNPEDYNLWYGLYYKDLELHKQATYCIPELHRQNVTPHTKIIANPGCYPTSIGLALAPLIKLNIAKLDTIIIDAKSGITGAGRELSDTTHFANSNEAFSPYKIANHRHTPEIEQIIKNLSNKDVKITFIPHLLPVNRGILSTIYVDLTENIDINKIHSFYTNFYKDDFFVRVLDNGSVANIKNVKFSNFCDISLHIDTRTNRLIIVSALDNMVKGASGQAIQNMNILFEKAETSGLLIVPPAI